MMNDYARKVTILFNCVNVGRDSMSIFADGSLVPGVTILIEMMPIKKHLMNRVRDMFLGPSNSNPQHVYFSIVHDYIDILELMINDDEI